MIIAESGSSSTSNSKNKVSMLLLFGNTMMNKFLCFYTNFFVNIQVTSLPSDKDHISESSSSGDSCSTGSSSDEDMRPKPSTLKTVNKEEKENKRVYKPVVPSNSGGPKAPSKKLAISNSSSSSDESLPSSAPTNVSIM